MVSFNKLIALGSFNYIDNVYNVILIKQYYTSSSISCCDLMIMFVVYMMFPNFMHFITFLALAKSMQ
jgi:hypothetical protein